MVGHQLVPALTGSTEIPICGSEPGINGFVRTELGFDGVVISDALDMGALDQGPAQVVEIIAMMRAGTDLILCMPDPELQQRARMALERGHSRGLISDESLKTSIARVEALRGLLPPTRLQPEVVGSSRHQQMAARLAAASVTLVRNDESLLPLRPGGGLRIFSLEPEPVNVTPADTTSLYTPQLAAALRAMHSDVTEVVYPHHPEPNDVAGAVEAARSHDLTVVGTVTAPSGQARLVEALLGTGKPVVTVALRTPYDLAVYPASTTHICTYGSHFPSLEAMASAMFGAIPFHGHLPAAIPGLHPTGHGIET
jgi:beta-N-acetylhexosaminidase